ncbi:MAG: hypothetical protein HYY55_01225 [Candidatus Niyogibacteria bacterium]|nr:MAG: hypothetical protein HYY55_01225 [Candidatus Niyogibacteria bacterium]
MPVSADQELKNLEWFLLEECILTQEVTRGDPKGCRLEAIEMFELARENLSVFESFRDEPESHVESAIEGALDVLWDKLKALFELSKELGVSGSECIEKALAAETLDYTDEIAKLLSPGLAYKGDERKYPEAYDELRKEIIRLFCRKYILQEIFSIRGIERFSGRSE